MHHPSLLAQAVITRFQKNYFWSSNFFSSEEQGLYDFLCLCDWSVLVLLRFQKQKPGDLTLGQEGHRRKNSCFKRALFFSDVGNVCRRRETC